jgi:hypothetical protein
MNGRRTLPFLLAAVLAATPCVAFEEAAGDWYGHLEQARRHAARGEPGFAVVEYETVYRQMPSQPDAAFAVGEHRFRRGQYPAAAEAFTALADHDTVEGILAAVHLRQCAEMAGDAEASALWEERLKDRLASRRYVKLFASGSIYRWTSPLGVRYELHESVDRMEIRRDGDSFHTISLP